MAIFPMLAQALAMVRKQQDQRFPGRRLLPNNLQESTQLLIFKRNLRIVRIVWILSKKLRRRIVGLVRIVQM